MILIGMWIIKIGESINGFNQKYLVLWIFRIGESISYSITVNVYSSNKMLKCKEKYWINFDFHT